jgi:uncharacterized protein YciI
MKNGFVTISSLGPNRDLSKGAREQPFWDEHKAFIDRLVDEGFILMGGPLLDENGMPQGALLIVNAENENEVKEKLNPDPWFERGILQLESINRWEIFVDARDPLARCAIVDLVRNLASIKALMMLHSKAD